MESYKEYLHWAPKSVKFSKYFLRWAVWIPSVIVYYTTVGRFNIRRFEGFTVERRG